MIQTSNDNYINSTKTENTSYKIDSSSINTSDINLVSVDNGFNGPRNL